MSPLEHALQAIVVVLVVVKLLALGAHKRWGWAVAVAAEAPWLTLAIMWQSWGMVALSVLYGGISARNWLAWAKRQAGGAVGQAQHRNANPQKRALRPWLPGIG